jgi:small redox-active disulfide protein 2
MKKLQILGTGCAKCNVLADVTKQAADGLGLQYEIEKVTDMMRFADFGVMLTPALVVNGVVKLSGKVPSLEEAKALLQD